MTVTDIADFTCRTVGDISSGMQQYAKDAIRLKYQTLYDAHAWRESMRVVDLVIDPTLQGTFFIPLDAEELIFCKFSRDAVNYVRLTYRERDWIERITRGNWLAPYNIPFFYRAENLAWPYLNPGKLTLQTSEITSFQVHIEGSDANGFRVQEDFLLLATQNPNGEIIPLSVVTANSYAKVTMISKGYGGLSIFSEFPSATLTVQAPQQITELIYSQFQIYPNPIQIDPVSGLPGQCYVQAQVKLKPDVLNNDMSVPRISHIWDALIEYTLSALYTRTRQLAKADAREQKAIAHVQAAVNAEKNQSEFRQQTVPTVYEYGDYLIYGTPYYVSSANPWGVYPY
jgi:hypothetical protein